MIHQNNQNTTELRPLATADTAITSIYSIKIKLIPLPAEKKMVKKFWSVILSGNTAYSKMHKRAKSWQSHWGSKTELLMISENNEGISERGF